MAKNASDYQIDDSDSDEDEGMLTQGSATQFSDRDVRGDIGSLKTKSEVEVGPIKFK